MKLVMQNWKWLTGLLAVGLIGATYLLAQIQTTSTSVATQSSNTIPVNVSPPNAAEAADSALLIDAVNSGDIKTVQKILPAYGVAEDTALDMATRLGQPPARIELSEPFLKASVGAWAVSGTAAKEQVRSQAAPAPGYERPVLVVRRLNVSPVESYDTDLMECPLAPIAVLNLKLDDPRFIRFFQWYNRYAERLHSVVLNGEYLMNNKLEAKDYARANRTLNALFQLIKARKPDAFVWLGVDKKDSRFDEAWLKAMTFHPDGLQISNLRQFHSPFERTRQRYMEIVGTNMPMMVMGFYGQKAALEAKGNLLRAALNNTDPQTQQAAVTTAQAGLANIGAAVGQGLDQLETNLQSLGYCGLSVHWLLSAALANKDNAGSIDTSDLIDPRAGLLETYYWAGDYASLYSFATEMITNSAPGDLDWTVGKLYVGIALMNQSPPSTSEAMAAFDDLLNFDFKGRPGRDHYILCAAEFRIVDAMNSGDLTKAQELVRWVQSREFRKGLKTEFMKLYGPTLTISSIPTQ